MTDLLTTYKVGQRFVTELGWELMIIAPFQDNTLVLVYTDTLDWFGPLYDVMDVDCILMYEMLALSEGKMDTFTNSAIQ